MKLPETKGQKPETTPTHRLDALIKEAKRDLEPRVTRTTEDAWAAMEARLVARVSAERASLVDEVNVTSLPARRRARLFQLGAAALAVAASIAFFVSPETRKDSPSALIQPDSESAAGALRSTEGTGEVRVGGVAATAGHQLRAGDLVEAQGARAVLERPRKVLWLLESGTAQAPGEYAGAGRARVKSAGESLVLGLEDGAIEAQVTPVPSGEAFAVDIATDTSLVRVAVHGTHLRVTRSGSHVTVDLTEGIVSIGTPPRSGSTYGTLVTAPSHVEFDAANLAATLTVDHAVASVRTAVPLVPQEGPTVARGELADPSRGAARETPAVAPDSRVAVGAEATVPRPVTPSRLDPARDPSRSDPTKASAGKPGVAPRDAIAQAVRECGAARHRGGDVRVTVTSSLKLRINPSGDVETAQFDPPLAPEIQTCAATAIYKAKIEESAGGTVTIPIDFSY